MAIVKPYALFERRLHRQSQLHRLMGRIKADGITKAVKKTGCWSFLTEGHKALDLGTAMCGAQESIAVTQNYVSEANLPHVLKFLAGGSAELVSGCSMSERANLHDHFVSALEERRPDALKKIRQDEEAARLAAKERHRLASLFKPAQPLMKKPRLAGEAGLSEIQGAANSDQSSEEKQGQFSFGFAFSKE